MHGASNDFVMVDDREGHFPADDRDFISRMGARRTGIGCEGIILVRNSAIADFAMKFFNPDGSPAELCGNGARCVAAFALSIGVAKHRSMRFESDAGMIEAEVLDDNLVKVVMPNPKDLRQNFVNTGVPHCIVPVTNLSDTDVDGEGRRIRYSDAFAPFGTNVDFVTYDVQTNKVSIRTYERGVEAESGACGTGAVAAAVVGVAQYGMRFPVSVSTSAGFNMLVDGFVTDGQFRFVTLTGPVCFVYDGVYERKDH